MDRLSELLGQHVHFSYTALDRLVLNAYIGTLQRPENLVHFFHNVVQVACIEPEVLARRSDAYKAWVRQYTQDEQIPVLQAPKAARKEDLVQPYYRRLKGREGIACVLTSMERGKTFTSYTPRFPTKSGDGNYRRISACYKQFLHYYFYLLDPVMGPMSLRVASYLPFNLTFYLNGHSFLAQELTRQGVGFGKEDNALLAVDDVAALEAAAKRLTAEVLRQRCEHWRQRLAPRFTPKEEAAFPLRYRYSLAQVELASDVIFKRSAPLKALFQRAAELGILLGGAQHTTHLFGRRITARYQGKLQTVLDRRDQGHPSLRCYYQSSFVKQYEKSDRVLRTETCINDTHHLDVKRPLENLSLLLERMSAINQRYRDLQAELLDSIVDVGQLTALASPTQLGKRRIPGIKLHDERVLRLLEVLLQPGAFIGDWTTPELHAHLLQRHRLSPTDYTLSQLRYDLSKLRGKGLVQRLAPSRRYRLTDTGLRLGMLLVKLRFRFWGPLCTLAAPPTPRRSTGNPSKVEAALRRLDKDLDALCATLGLRVA